MLLPTTKGSLRWLAAVALAALCACGSQPEPFDGADAGATEDAATESGTDANAPSHDAGPQSPDAGPTADTGLAEESDAGATGTDAGQEPPDASQESPDASAPADASLPPPDAGPEADAGARPYQELENLRDSALKAALYDRVKGHTALSYDNGSKPAMFGGTVAGNPVPGFDVINGKVECIYSGLLFDPSLLDAQTGTFFNVEHSWPKSNGAGSPPAESDMHHLFPSESRINSARSSNDFGNTDCTTTCSASAGGSKLGPIIGGTKNVFQVRDLRKGDIARAHFYFSVRYQMAIPPAEETALRGWNQDDPPDDRERARNLAIETFQHNRNPFIERPDFVNLISDF